MVANNGPSFKVNSIHYEGSPVFEGIPLLDASEIKSMKSRYKMSTFSHQFGEEPVYNYDGDDVVFKTANNTFRVPRWEFENHGEFYNIDDFNIKDWFRAAEDNPPVHNDVVPTFPELVRSHLREYHGFEDSIPEGIIEGKPERVRLPNKRDTDVNLYTTQFKYYLVPFNDTGKKLSEVENMRQYLLSHSLDKREMHRDESNPESYAHLKKLSETRGFRNPDQLGGYGVLEQGRDEIASTIHYKKGHAYFVMNPNFEVRVDKIMERLGLEGRREKELVIDSIWNHEDTHLFDKAQLSGLTGENILRRIKIERLVGKVLKNFYGERAKEVGEDKANVYEALAEDNRRYIDSITKHHLKELLFGKKNSRNSKYKNLEARLTSEAMALGLKGEEVVAYVAEHISSYENLEAIEDSDKIDTDSEKGNGLESKLQSSGEDEDSEDEESEKPYKKVLRYSKVLSKAQVYERNDADEKTDSEDSESSDDSEAEEGESSESSSE